MKSIRCANVVVVADSDHGLVLAARLRRMEVAGVTTVGGVEEARRLCREGGVDACLVTVEEAIADALPKPGVDAPGCGCGVPSLMIVPAVTPYLRREARRAGYVAAVPAGIAPRMLYRRIGAALQHRRAARRHRRLRASMSVRFLGPSPAAFAGKPTLH